MVFELEQPLLPGVVKSLLPPGSAVAVLSQGGADHAGLIGYEAVPLSAPAAAEAIDELEQLAGDGVQFLVIPRSSFAWCREELEFVEHLRSRHRFITRQEQAGELWELESAPASGEPAREPEPAPPAASAERARADGGKRLLGVFPLSWKRGGS
jgi:hypothetical protein